MSSFFKHFSYLLIILFLFCCSKKPTDGVEPPSPAYPIICDTPAWSPDGKTIAYWYSGIKKVRPNGGSDADLTQRGIWFINPDGTNKRMFLWGGDLPDWNPVELELVFVMDAQIYTIKLNGDSLTQLTFEGRNFFPDWSPDGKRIAHVRTIGTDNGIWIMDSDGNNKELLEAGRYAGYPDWSQDGNKILCEIPSYTPGEPYVDHYFWIISLVDTNHIRLPLIKGDNRYPQWSPDGSRIVFSSAEESLPQIFIMDTDGSNLKQLTTEGGTYPAWSPDGSEIVYVRYSDEYSSKHGQLWIMDADGSNKRQLTYDGW